jgi:hypothetical protein
MQASRLNSLLATSAHQATEPSRTKLCPSSLHAKLRNPRSEPPRQAKFGTSAPSTQPAEPSLKTSVPSCGRNLCAKLCSSPPRAFRATTKKEVEQRMYPSIKLFTSRSFSSCLHVFTSLCMHVLPMHASLSAVYASMNQGSYTCASTCNTKLLTEDASELCGSWHQIAIEATIQAKLSHVSPAGLGTKAASQGLCCSPSPSRH